MLPNKVHGTLLLPKERYTSILQIFRSNPECILIPTICITWPSHLFNFQTFHNNKEMMLSTNHEAPLFTFSLVQIFSSTPDLTQSLPHMFRSCNEDPIFHLAVHNPPTSQLQMLRSHHTRFAHPSNARNSSK
jgi:hypothetical protein